MHELILRQFLQRSLSASRRCSGSSATRLPKIGPIGFLKNNSRREKAVATIENSLNPWSSKSSKLNSTSSALHC